MSLNLTEVELAKDLIKELRKSREAKERIEIEEIDARDRVNISLKMYEEMRNKIQEYYEDNKKLVAEIDYLKDLFVKIGIPEEFYDNLDPSSVDVVTYKNDADNTKKYRISFSVSDK